MFRNAAVACFLAVFTVFAIQTAGVQTAPAPQTAFVDGMQASVSNSIGAQDISVEITLTDAVLTVSRVNSNQNASNHTGRNNEATSIASVASKALTTNAASAGVHTIRVQYLSRDSAHPKGDVIDTIEFRKNAKGEFEIHVT
jgi:hypothetical protein